MEKPDFRGNTIDLLTFSSELSQHGQTRFELDHEPTADELDELALYATQMSPYSVAILYDSVQHEVIISVVPQ